MNLGQQILGGTTAENENTPVPVQPNRAQRRAAAQERARKQRRGQRAFNRMQSEE